MQAAPFHGAAAFCSGASACRERARTACLLGPYPPSRLPVPLACGTPTRSRSMREEIEKEAQLSEKEIEEINAGVRTLRHDDGVAQVRRPRQPGDGGGSLRRQVDVEA